MFQRNEIKIETQLDAIDALNDVASTLRGLGFLSVSFCESPSVVDEDVFGLFANILYYCADVESQASNVLHAPRKSASSEVPALSNLISANSVTAQKLAA